MINNRIKGNFAETIALKYLEKHDYKLIDRNFLINKIAEIDLIVKKDTTLYFVEVKYRFNNKFGSPLDAITQSKLKHIYRAADYFLLKSPEYNNFLVKLKVICISKDQNGVKLEEFDV